MSAIHEYICYLPTYNNQKSSYLSLLLFLRIFSFATRTFHTFSLLYFPSYNHFSYDNLTSLSYPLVLFFFLLSLIA
jgi:hypothetical protein